MSSKTIGIRDVAAAAGVSATTVSHVLNGVASARVSAETRARVQAAAEQLGYGPDRVARALRTRRTGLLGLICEDIGASPHAGRILLGADEAASSRGYNLLVINIPASSRAEYRTRCRILAPGPRHRDPAALRDGCPGHPKPDGRRGGKAGRCLYRRAADCPRLHADGPRIRGTPAGSRYAQRELLSGTVRELLRTVYS
ncbi:MAG TPA: hypothetical protein DIT15_00435 [Arthrobacter bacterium]|nr:hypothetical protein [Arthrobacter sp.]HCN20723.1 hypothetical protein [Arthrobacter sp.]